MNIRSCKKKGRTLCVKVKEFILAAAPELEQADISIPPPSCPGEDIWLSPRARKVFPVVIECKNQEKAKPWEWIAQAKTHSHDGRCPVVVFSRNHEPEPFVIVSLRDFLFLTVDQSKVIKKDNGESNEGTP